MMRQKVAINAPVGPVANIVVSKANATTPVPNASTNKISCQTTENIRSSDVSYDFAAILDATD